MIKPFSLPQPSSVVPATPQRSATPFNRSTPLQSFTPVNPAGMLCYTQCHTYYNICNVCCVIKFFLLTSKQHWKHQSIQHTAASLHPINLDNIPKSLMFVAPLLPRLLRTIIAPLLVYHLLLVACTTTVFALNRETRTALPKVPLGLTIGTMAP